jgi:hypothetical protein
VELSQVSVVGFTGAQGEPTVVQFAKGLRILIACNPLVVHHGDCIGTDAQFHQAVRGLRSRGELHCSIHVHPPVIPDKRAWCEIDEGWGDVMHPEEDYMPRNEAIVAAVTRAVYPVDVNHGPSGLLLALPGQMHPVRRSGTWATYRRAERARVPRIMVFPDGTNFSVGVSGLGCAGRSEHDESVEALPEV